jgi:ATP-dependent DNA helicase RecG
VNRQELLKRLKGHEWTDVEFKEAQQDVPKNAYETVSAFSNTRGGWLVFGVRDAAAGYEVSGVANVDKVQSDFLSALHADNKVNHDIPVEAHLIRVAGKTVLVFHIPEATRQHKPLYLDGDIRRTFLRRGGGNYKAQMQDIERMLRDAASDRWDGQVFDRVSLKEAFDRSSLAWYRNRFHQVNEGFDAQQPNEEFLREWGYLARSGKKLLPTRAAIMLFGSLVGVRQLIPKPVLDVQFLPYATDEEMPETRWIDRFVAEENIIQTWQQLLAKYKFFMPKPFRDIDPVTLERRDTPPGFRVFREAAMNLLIHQDYGDHSRKAVIKFFRDGIQFWNPGDVFGDDTRLLEPGEKEVRNPAIAAAMRRITMCEQAGTGFRMMQREWQSLGHPAPVMKNDRAHKAFELFVPGLDKEVDMASDLIKAMFGGAPQVKAPVKAPVEAPVEAPVGLHAADRALLVALAPGECGRSDLLKTLGHAQRSGNFKKVIERLLREHLIERTIPSKPNSRLQKYRLTPKGVAYLNARKPKA